MSGLRVRHVVTWRGTCAPFPRDGQQRLVLDSADGSIVELTMSAETVEQVIETLRAFQNERRLAETDQSSKSSEILHSEGSRTPGQSQLPPTNSSKAIWGDE
ncbi:hypothetical protein [Tritonibacter mobilis]|uniref:hypothetical protein n=1 Tax=Tritonibacter mobilis TaxID=379347 RepID=UPI000806E7B0|nr:hypothetical protein [Tritonibacter mobilis]